MTTIVVIGRERVNYACMHTNKILVIKFQGEGEIRQGGTMNPLASQH